MSVPTLPILTPMSIPMPAPVPVPVQAIPISTPALTLAPSPAQIPTLAVTPIPALTTAIHLFVFQHSLGSSQVWLFSGSIHSQHCCESN